MTKIIKRNSLTNEEMTIIMSVQGIVNKKLPQLYIDIDNYMNYVNDNDIEYISFFDCINIFKDYIKGIVIYDYIYGDVSLNIASSISGIFDYIILPKSYEHLLGLFDNLDIIDITSMKGDYVDRQKCIFEKYKNYFNKDGLIHQVCTKDNFHITLRDQGIANKWFCFYTGEDEKAKAFRKEVLKWANSGIGIYGWTTDEIDFVDDISKYGDYVIPSDWSCNHSYLDKFNSVTLKQNVEAETILPSKHYLTIVVSDGDNAQWLERDFSTTSTFGKRMASPNNYPISFTIAPSLTISAPQVIEYIYKNKKNDYFISGVSGAGYMNPCAFPKDHLPKFCNKTKELLQKCDINVVTLLDNLKNRDKIICTINEYAKDESLIGGIYELDPDKYEGGCGEVFFSDNGKPFASVRVSFWSNDGTNDTVTDEWISSIANKINSFKIDSTSIEGYTVLNVHPWSTTIEDLDKLVSKLSDHIQIIRTDNFLKLLKNNVLR